MQRRTQSREQREQPARQQVVRERLSRKRRDQLVQRVWMSEMTVTTDKVAVMINIKCEMS